MSQRIPVVAVVGRPNVGKSTLFNRFLGERLAIVDDRPGVTRDRHFARADWAGHVFFVVDTGGIVEGSDEPMDRQIREQALAAVAEADLILFIVDAKDGVHPLDQAIAEILRKEADRVILVANKSDRFPHDDAFLDFWSLGMGEPLPMAANTGAGSGNVLDRVVERFADLVPRELPGDDSTIRVAVIGKPNSGKSSLVNRLFGEERMVVSEIPGTTRDAVDSTMHYHGKDLVFVDTAGLRRQAKVKDSLEYYSALRTARVIREADVALLLADASEGITVQDLKIADQAWEAGCSVILVVNKWDLVEKDHKTAQTMEKELVARAPQFRWIPTLFASALTGLRARKTLDLILEVNEERNRRIPTHEVNEVMEELMRRQSTPHVRGRQVKFRYSTQASTAPPEFVLFCNLPGDVPENYIRFIHNGFRERWGFKGAPLRIRLRRSNQPS